MMVTKTDLTYEKKASILTIYKQNVPLKAIALQIDRIISDVRSYIINNGALNKFKIFEFLTKMSPTIARSIVLKYYIENYTDLQLLDRYNTPVSFIMVKQILRSTVNLKYKNYLKDPRPNKKQKVARLNYAREYVRFSDENSVKFVFTD